MKVNAETVAKAYNAKKSKEHYKAWLEIHRTVRWIRIKCWFWAKKGYGGKHLVFKNRYYDEVKAIANHLTTYGFTCEWEANVSNAFWVRWDDK